MFYRDEEPKRAAVSISEFRRRLSHYVHMVRYGESYVAILRKGMEPVYLVSRADMDLIWEKTDELNGGPRDEKGRRSGWGLMNLWRRDRDDPIL